MKGKIGDLLNAIYPDLCVTCDLRYPVEGSCFCFHCLSDLPFTGFENESDNLVEKFFWGRMVVEKATALFYFHKGELIQEVLHRLKYKNQGFIGTSLGTHFGNALKEANFLEAVDLIIPIPIHNSKRRKRNYNQSALIAHGISKVCKIPYSDKLLEKHKKTPSQTAKTREERIQNLLHTFRVRKIEALRGRHILLVDDILTTGATLEAAGSILSELDCKLSVAVVAVGKY